MSMRARGWSLWAFLVVLSLLLLLLILVLLFWWPGFLGRKDQEHHGQAPYRSRLPPLDPSAIVFDPSTGLPVVANQLLVLLAPGATVERLEDDLRRDKGIALLDRGELGSLVRVSDRLLMLQGAVGASLIDPPLLAALRALPSVAGVAKNGLSAAAGSPGPEKAWGIHAIRAPQAWDRTQGEGAIVAVVDTSCDFTHADLVDRFCLATTWRPDEVEPWKPHGTKVVATIAGSARGPEWAPGVAPRCWILAMEAMWKERNGPGSWISDAQIGDAVSWAVEYHAAVVNLSIEPVYTQILGELTSGDAAVRDQRIAALRKDRDESQAVREEPLRKAAERGVVCVVAAGNYAFPADWWWIAHSEHAIGVAACDSNGDPARFDPSVAILATAFEGSAPEDPGRAVDLCAPGLGTWTCAPGGTYEAFAGTSAAAPHVAGVAALLKSLSPAAPFKVVLDVLATTGAPAPATATVDIGVRVDAAAAVEEMLRRRDGGDPVPRRRPSKPSFLAPNDPAAKWSPVAAEQVELIGVVLGMDEVQGGWFRRWLRFQIDGYLRTPMPNHGARLDEYGRSLRDASWSPGPPADLGARDRFQYAWDHADSIVSPERNEAENARNPQANVTSLRSFVLRAAVALLE